MDGGGRVFEPLSEYTHTPQKLVPRSLSSVGSERHLNIFFFFFGIMRVVQSHGCPAKSFSRETTISFRAAICRHHQFQGALTPNTLLLQPSNEGWEI